MLDSARFNMDEQNVSVSQTCAGNVFERGALRPGSRGYLDALKALTRQATIKARGE